MPSIVFVDSRVANYQSLIDSLTEPADVFVLDGASDGLAQMAAYLQGRTGIDAIHVISHGSQGAIYLGSTVLDSGSLALHGSQLARIGGALTETGDILLYGCNVAQGDAGLQFINSLAQYTGADLAASSDATGAAVLGGDWVLERGSGPTQAAAIQNSYSSGLFGSNAAPMLYNLYGKLTTSIGTSDDFGSTMVLQPDGKILVAGFSYNAAGNSDIAVVRYNSNGSLDTTFDGDGKLTTAIWTSDDVGYTMLLQPDGKFLVAGDISVTAGNTDFAVVRYNSNGSLDTTFDGDGRLTTALGASFDFSYTMVLQPDGKILVAGDSYNDAGNFDFAVVRYNSDGSFDTTFDGDGKLTTAIWTSADIGRTMALQPDGKILVAGDIAVSTGNSDFAVVRYNSNGSLDTTFDGDGRLTTAIGFTGLERGYTMALQPDGKILVAGSSNYAGTTDFAVVRYNSNGSLDTMFDVDGKLTTALGASDDFSYTMALQPDGKILVAGASYNAAGNSDFAVVRYNSNGSLDTTFDGDGKLTTAIGTSTDVGSTMVLQPDGKILVAGFSSNATGNSDFAVVRYNSNGSLDTTFGPTFGYLISSYTENAIAIQLQSTISVVDAELSAAGSYDGATLTLARHDGASSQDVFSAFSSTLTKLQPLSYFAVDGITIGTVAANSGGTLSLAFNASATQALVNKAMQQIAYTNSSNAPPAQVQIDWTFNDGNTGLQGTDGAKSTVNSSTVLITQLYDAPSFGTQIPNQNWVADVPFSYAVPAQTFNDPDQSLVYSIRMLDGTGIPPWLTFNTNTKTFSGAPSKADSRAFDIQVLAVDSRGVLLTNVFHLTVLPPDNSAPTVTTFSPPSGSSGHGVASNIVITFNESIFRGTGSILLKTTEGTTVASYDAATSTNLSISGSTLTINPTADLGSSNGYKVEFDAGTIKDLGGNGYAGTTSYSFITAGSVIQGTTGDDIYTGGSGNDTISGGDGSDWLYGAGGADTINGDAGNDHLYGQAGDDVINGGDGADILSGGDGNDTLSGGNGFDIAEYSGTRSIYIITKSAANITVSGGEGVDVLTNIEQLQFFDEQIIFNSAPTGTVTIIGTALQNQKLSVVSTLADLDGLGTINYQWAASGVAISGATQSSLTLSESQVGKAISVSASYTDGRGTLESVASNATGTVANVNDLPTGDVTIIGTPRIGIVLNASYAITDIDGLGTIKFQWFADGVAIGGATSNTLVLDQSQLGKGITVKVGYTDGHGTQESVTSGITTPIGTVFAGITGDDVFMGGLGNDNISGGDGSDWLYGGGGSDTINGDAGNDYLYGQAGNDVLDGGDGADIVSGGNGNDTVSGGNGDDGMYGDTGVDTMSGNGGGDFMAGGDDNDILHGDDGQDWLYGEWGDDTLYGDAGNDILFGNFGNDTLIGGLGNDTMFGNDGGDTFVFTANQGEDFIVDFSVAQGDHISIASGTNGITTAAQALAHMRDSGANAVLDLGAGSYVMLMGVATSALHVTDFVIA